jgi:hypothetical protein
MSKQCETSCSTSANTEASCSCSSNTLATLEVDKKSSSAKSAPGQTLGGVLMLGVACLACCAPLIAPVILGLVAGTPLAALLTFSSGWLVGGLALLLVMGFTLAWRMRNKAQHISANVHQ